MRHIHAIPHHSALKNRDCDTHYSTDEPWGHYAQTQLDKYGTSRLTRRYLEEVNSQRPKTEWKVPEAGAGIWRELLLPGAEFQLRRWKHSGNAWQQWLYNNVSVLNAPEPYTRKWLIGSILCYVYFTNTRVKDEQINFRESKSSGMKLLLKPHTVDTVC